MLREITIHRCFLKDLHASPPWDPMRVLVHRLGNRGPER